MGIKRKPRNKMAKKLNTLFPIPLEAFGSQDDPCFGKHHSPTENACQRCGDNELCQIKMAQLNHLKREEEEKTQPFRDIEEREIYEPGYKKQTFKEPEYDEAELKKAIRRKIKKYSPVDIDEMAKRVNKTFPMITTPQLVFFITKMAKKSSKFTLKKSTLKWIG